MLQRVLSPVLVGRQEQLSQLEDALLTANRGDGRFVLLAGEAGIGKTRLATELGRRARKLGGNVLCGSCSEAELSLPYLPFVEAIGNHLAHQDPAVVRAELGPPASELARLIPQLGEGPPATSPAETAQAKVRLFESVVALLELWTRNGALLVVVDDIHWADGSTRELLDYAARRLAKTRVMLLAAYRSDELDRTHPLTRAVQVWRRSGLAETVSVGPMARRQVAEMIAAILGAEDVSADLAALVHERSDGNPFVLEEMLREAVDRGEIFQDEGGWQRRPLDAFQLPETVREALLLRLGRLDTEHVEVLRAAAVLGRSFDYRLLVEVAVADEHAVFAALDAAVSQQLLEEDPDAAGRYRWRHALTQEAIASDTVLPKRLRAHSRAADALLGASGESLAVARHLLAAGRVDEAADACLRAAEEAERAVAFTEAAELLERVLPHLPDRRDRALLLYRIGRLRWLNGEAAAAEQFLTESIQHLDDLGLAIEAAHARVYLSRCRWELDQPAAAMQDVEQARGALEKQGPSAELALAWLRIAGLHAFQLDYDRCRIAAERAVEIAERASADFELLWARTFVALGYFGSAREFEMFDECYREALEKGYALIAGNLVHNEIWDRVHSLVGGLDGALAKYEDVPFHTWSALGIEVARSWALLAVGRPRDALEEARKAIARHESRVNPKFGWRAHLAAAEALLELGRTSEASAELPPPSPGNELQDIVYDTPARVRIAIALGQHAEPAELGRRAVGHDALLRVRGNVAVAVEGLLAGGALDEAQSLVARAKRLPFEDGNAGVELAEARVLVASGRAREARPLLERALAAFEESGLRLWACRTRAVAAEAAAQTGDREAARDLFASCIDEAHAAGALRVRDDAVTAAVRRELEIPPLGGTPEEDHAAPGVVPAGERLVTSMFADVRDYTPLATASVPEELADRLMTLHRWAATEVGRRRGVVDKFAGDAVMATFNALGARLDHAVLALDAALALRDRAALIDLPVAVGIAVGPAVVTRSVDGGNVSVLGPTTNLAARLQTAARGGEILLSDEAFRRVAPWLSERGLVAEPEELELKGFDGTQRAYRLSAPVPVE
jgi:class 3 adenylate cyclase